MYLTPDAMDRMTDDYRAHRVRHAERQRFFHAGRGDRRRTSPLGRIGAAIFAAWPTSTSSPRRRTHART